MFKGYESRDIFQSKLTVSVSFFIEVEGETTDDLVLVLSSWFKG
jgi:hypothetical protein